MRKFRLSSKAIEDLDRIWLYTEERWSISQAEKIYDEIRDSVYLACQNPEIGKPYDSIYPGLKGILVQAFILFYKLASNDTIEVERILHQSQDHKSHL